MVEQKAGAHSAIQRTALELNSSTQQWEKIGACVLVSPLSVATYEESPWLSPLLLLCVHKINIISCTLFFRVMETRDWGEIWHGFAHAFAALPCFIHTMKPWPSSQDVLSSPMHDRVERNLQKRCYPWLVLPPHVSVFNFLSQTSFYVCIWQQQTAAYVVLSSLIGAAAPVFYWGSITLIIWCTRFW